MTSLLAADPTIVAKGHHRQCRRPGFIETEMTAKVPWPPGRSVG